MRFAASGGGKDSAGITVRSLYAKYGKIFCLLIGIIVGSLISGLFSFNRDNVDTAPRSDSGVIVPNISPAATNTLPTSKSLQVLSSDYSAEEKNFLTTFRSCLRKNCFDDPVKLKNQNEQKLRIGLLTPDLSGSKPLLDMFETMGLLSKSDLDIVADTNVPAYGYGKNHGWSKIIRIVRDVVPHAYTLLDAKYPNDGPLVTELFGAQVRIYIQTMHFVFTNYFNL